MNRRTKTESDYRRVAIKRGIQWVGLSLPENVLVDTEWVCANGHKFIARYSDLQQGRGCGQCSGRSHKTLEDYQELGKRKGLVYVYEKPVMTRLKAPWRLPDGSVEDLTWRQVSYRPDVE